MTTSPRKTSIMKKLIRFLVIILSIQCILFAGFILLGGTIDQLNQNAMDILEQRTLTRKNYLENEMLQRWSNLDQMQSAIDIKTRAFLAEQDMNYTDLCPGDERTAELMGQFSDPLIALMRRNSVTGAFIIFNGDQPMTLPTDGQTRHYSGLYYRDLDPTSNPDDNSDLMVERGSSSLLRDINIPMDIHWAPTFSMGADDSASYYAPLLAAMETPGLSASDLGLWAGAYCLYGDEVPIVTYTQPLLGPDGLPYGVLGVELCTDYLRRLMPSSELDSEKNAAYLLAFASEEAEPGVYDTVASNGALALRIFGEDRSCQFTDKPTYASIYQGLPTHASTDKIFASIQPFTLYNTNTPFSGQQWVLIGLTEGNTLFSFSHSITLTVALLSLFLLVLGIVLSCIAGSVFTKPIRTLAGKVQTLDPSLPVALPPINVSEIDELSAAIESMSQNVAEASSRISKIIDMAGLSLAAYQLDPGAAHPYYTKEFFSLLGKEEPESPPSASDFTTLMASLSFYIEESNSDGSVLLYRFPLPQGNYRWVRQQTVRSGGSVLGVLVDATEEITERRRIEYERDYDPLTNLLNRRSFHARLTKLEGQPEQLKLAAMVMLDLDNLKYLNDTYGHDCGDEYIRCAADVLREFTAYGGLASRISGDEFYLFLSGYDSQEALQARVIQLQGRLSAASITLPDGLTHKLRASVGVAWYPDDSESLVQLTRYADFAMYEAKNAMKGSMRNFDIRTYQEDSFLLYSREELNRILEEGAIDYVFQPIVDCRTGQPLGYEALMRPRSQALSSPTELLRIARSQSKLPQVEQLTWFKAMETFRNLPCRTDSTLVFINSIPSQALSPDDLAVFDSAFADELPYIVIELTEGDEMNASATAIKQSRAKRLHMHLAIDDFGTGYSNDLLLLNVAPDYVKVDMSIIRGINEDTNRQALFRNLVDLCRNMNVKVIAEGVETEEELFTVVRLGADYIQGYLTGKPAPCPGPITQRALRALRRAQEAAGNKP